MWGPDAPVVPPRRALNEFLIACGVFGSIAGLCWMFMPARPAIPREYPFSGLEKELGGNPVCSCFAHGLGLTVLTFASGQARGRGTG